MIKVRLIGRLAEGLQSREIVVEGEGRSVEAIIIELEELTGKRLREILFDERGELREGFLILLNGHAVRGSPKETTLAEGDELVILPPVSGGTVWPW